MTAEYDVSGLLPAQGEVVGRHVLIDIAVPDRCLLIANSRPIQSLIEAQIGHDGHDNGALVQLPPLI